MRPSLASHSRSEASLAGGMRPWPEAEAGVPPSDREPYHYSFEMLARLAELAGGSVERVDDRSHPRGESILAIHKR